MPAIDLDVLAAAVLSRLDQRRQARETAAAHADLVVDLDDSRSVVASLLAELDDMSSFVAGRFKWRHGWIRVGMHPFDPGTDRAEIRARGLSPVPPAWTDVQVADDPKADLQYIGRDEKGRDQRRYSKEHTERQAAAKFERIRAMHESVPQIDRRLAADAPGNDDAAALMLIRRMGLRPGSDTDTGAERKAYGATNLLAEHVTVDKDVVRLQFGGKSGKDLDLEMEDPELAGMLTARLAGKTPGQKLFATNERKVGAYLHSIDDRVKVKDLRTYHGTATARRIVAGMEAPTNRKEHTRAVKEVAKAVSQILGNTPAVALSSYIDPDVFTAWRDAADLR